MSQHTTLITYRGVLLHVDYEYEAATPGSRTEAPTREYVGVQRIRTEHGDPILGLFAPVQLICIQSTVLAAHHEDEQDARTEARIRDLEVNHG